MAEETFFRGFLFGGLEKRLGIFWAALASGFLFSLAHGQVSTLVPFTFVGMMLAWAYVVHGIPLGCHRGPLPLQFGELQRVGGRAGESSVSRIAATFARTRAEKRPAVVPFLTAGYPDLAATPALVEALVAGGADMVELGIPFSDPLADGVTIQRAGLTALEQGVTAGDCLEVVRELRSRGLEIPILLMGYYNPILAYGPEAFVADLAAAGGDGLIAVDLPPEESEELRGLCRAHGLDLIYLLAPTSGAERIAKVAALASGFLYCVSVAGVTGARTDLPPGLATSCGRCALAQTCRLW